MSRNEVSLLDKEPDACGAFSEGDGNVLEPIW